MARKLIFVRNVIMIKKTINILIGTPNQGSLKTEFVDGLLETLFEGIKRNVEIDFYPVRHTLFIHTRNEILRLFKEGNYDYLFWIDSDTKFNAPQFYHAVDIINNSEHINVLCAPIRIRNYDGEARYNIVRSNMKSLTEEDIVKEKNIFEIEYTGMAFMIHNKEAVDNIDEFRIDKYKSEGGHFCDDLHKNGIKIHCHQKIRPGHIFDTVNY